MLLVIKAPLTGIGDPLQCVMLSNNRRLIMRLRVRVEVSLKSYLVIRLII